MYLLERMCVWLFILVKYTPQKWLIMLTMVIMVGVVMFKIVMIAMVLVLVLSDYLTWLPSSLYLNYQSASLTLLNLPLTLSVTLPLIFITIRLTHTTLFPLPSSPLLPLDCRNS
jgi:ABC-type dipeptide/oligopeptide/nickel transport system permease component